MPVAVTVVIVFLVVALLAFGLLFVRFLNSPASRWKVRIYTALLDSQRRLRRARSELAAVGPDTDDRDLRYRLLIQQLEGVPVEELARYPGIGPITVSRLREAGLTTVAACARAQVSALPGIHRAREAALKDALRMVVREAESRFDAGASPQAAAYAAERTRRERDPRRQAVQDEVRRAQEALAALQPALRLADQITFFGHLRGKLPPGLDAEVMDLLLAVAEPAPPAINQHTGVHTPSARTVVLDRTPSASPSPPAGVNPMQPAASTAPAAKPNPAPVEVTPLARLRAVAGLGLAMAKADGRIAAAERRQVRAFVERRYCPADLAARLNAILEAVEKELPTLGDALGEIRRVIPEAGWPELYHFAASVADSAGERNAREIEYLARVAEDLGIGVKPPPHVPAPVVAAEPKPPLTEPDCRTLLEIAPDTPLTVELIRRQYHVLSARFDPSRFADHGPEFAQMAAEKRDKIERAARHLLAAYNEPLEAPAASPPPADLRHNPDLDDVFGA